MVSWYEDGKPWYPSKWGSDDDLGTLNNITTEKVVSATRLVKKGKVYSLANEIYPEMSQRPGRPFYYAIEQRHTDDEVVGNTRNKVGGSVGRLEMTDHLATHLDTFSHISYDGMIYNGVDANKNTKPGGVIRHSVHQVPPIITRGIMIDLTLIKPMEEIEKGHIFSAKEVEKFLEDRSLSIEKGDAVLFHTGMGKYWHDKSKWDYLREHHGGVGYEVAEYLSHFEPAIFGSDSQPSEAYPSGIDGVRLPVHQLFLTKMGIRLLDIAKLSELARDKVYEFMFVLSVLPIRGATGSPVSPIAVI